MTATEPMGDGCKERGQIGFQSAEKKESAYYRTHRTQIHSLLPVPGWSVCKEVNCIH
jgi:hypothetical protein